jgi:hypothetical protein
MNHFSKLMKLCGHDPVARFDLCLVGHINFVS